MGLECLRNVITTRSRESIPCSLGIGGVRFYVLDPVRDIRATGAVRHSQCVGQHSRTIARWIHGSPAGCAATLLLVVA